MAINIKNVHKLFVIDGKELEILHDINFSIVSIFKHIASDYSQKRYGFFHLLVLLVYI